jgi:PiT family inorganic phosphate transporter
MHFDTPIGTFELILFVVALAIACGFEFVNGFHDTANAVATVIYTRSLRPWAAVILSGSLNLLGVYLGGIAVAMSIIKLLPVELLAASGAGAGLAMVLALLVAAIVWNLGTWWLGLPASSSHTLIGAIVGVGLANSLMPGHVFASGVNWHKVQEIGMSLLVSPIFGLGAAAILLLLARKWLMHKALHEPAHPDRPPPLWIRGILVTTCSGVSFAHGSNDGQKGVGLIMLILIGLLPADYALNTALTKTQIGDTVAIAERLQTNTRDAFGGDTGRLASNANVAPPKTAAGDVLADLGEIRAALGGRSSIHDVPADRRFDVRARIMRVDSQLAALEKGAGGTVSAAQLDAIKKDRQTLRSSIDYAPTWVIVIIALSLGVGTMIGWKRIVVTVGEKIGKTHLTYAQGASAEIVAMSTIGLAGWFGLPVSTTHVLSSGIAGTMVAQRSGLQRSTVRNIALAWVLTLPAATILAGALFLFFRAILPAAHASTTPTVQFDKAGEESAVMPVSTRPLRLHGSNTIGADLAPALAAGLLKELGANDVTRTKDLQGHAWVVSGHVPGQSGPAEIDIDAAGSATAFEDLAAGHCDLGMSSRMVTDAEAAMIKAAGLGDLRSVDSEYVIGLDGITVIVDAQNPVRSLTTEQLARLFAGEDASWPASTGASGAVDLFARDDKSGTLDTFKSLVLGTRALGASAKRFADSDALAAAVAADPQGIGFVGMSHVGRASPVAISEGGSAAIVPSRFSVATEDYPLTRRLYLYAPAPATHPLAPQLVAFAESPQGQTLVAAAGFVDLAATARDPEACTSCTARYVSLTKDTKRLSLNFRFRPGSADLDSRAERDVGRLAALLRLQRNPQVELLGFSDDQGASDTNLRLSRDRASAVAARLAAYGITASVVEGLGEDMPVASNATPAGRERNRRVEVWERPGG